NYRVVIDGSAIETRHRGLFLYRTMCWGDPVNKESNPKIVGQPIVNFLIKNDFSNGNRGGKIAKSFLTAAPRLWKRFNCPINRSKIRKRPPFEKSGRF
ncbi:MAG: hypothetical protein D6714_03925, partial [Bacteroidetes bacterium]